MEQSTKGIILLVSRGVTFAAVAHSLEKNFWKAALRASLTASLTFCVIVEFIDPDPLIAIAFFFGSLICFLIAVAVGAPFAALRSNYVERWRRRRRWRRQIEEAPNPRANQTRDKPRI